MEKIIKNHKYTYNCTQDIIYQNTLDYDGPLLNRTQTTEIVDLCVETTNLCNSFCINCFSRSGPGVQGKFLQFKAVEDYLKENSVNYIRVSLTGGEPFLHPEISSFLTLPNKFKNIGYVITTNASNLHAKRELLISNGWTIAISLHGRPDTHRRYTHDKNFKEVLSSIYHFSKYTITHIYCVLHGGLSQEDIDWLFYIRNDSNASFLRFIKPRNFGRYGSIASKNIFDYVVSKLDDRSALKVAPSNTHFLTVDGTIRLSS